MHGVSARSIPSGWIVAVVVAGCAPAERSPEATTVEQSVTCDLGDPGALVEACNRASTPTPINAAPLSSSTPPVIVADNGAYGVHLVEGATNEGALRFVPTQTATYDIYLGTPNIPFQLVVEPSTVAPSCTSSIASTDCAYLRKVISYQLVAGQTYRLEFGPTTGERYVRLFIQTRIPVAQCSPVGLTEEANACTAATEGAQPVTAARLGSSTAPALALDTVYGVHLPASSATTFGGVVKLVPPSDGDYELYLGTPNIPMHVAGGGGTVSLDCTRYIGSECSLLRRGDRLTLRGGVTYSITLGPIPNASYVRMTVRSSAASLVKLAPAQMFASGDTPYHLTAADLDGDHVLDLVVSSPDDAAGRNDVVVMRGASDGSFATVHQFPTAAPGETVVSDFDHDGIADIVGLANDGQGPLPAFYLHGLGALDYATTTWGDGRYFGSRLDAADFDEDGTLDLVAAYADDPVPTGAAGFVIVHAPSFSVVQDEPAFGHDTAQAIAGDFNGDGHQDVLVGSSTTGAVKLYTGDGSGMVTFAQDVSLPGGVVRELAAFDLDHDGRTDFVAIQSDFDGSNQSIVVCYGLASGFSAPVVLTPSGLTFAQGIAAGDFDHDGRTDLAIGTFGPCAPGDSTIDVFLATDTGFALGGTLTVPGGHCGSDFAVGDFNGDGFDDLAATGVGAVAVFLSTP